MSLVALQSKLNIEHFSEFDPMILRESVRYFKLSLIRAAHFFAQVSVTTSDFTVFEENLHLSSEELANKWPNYFARDIRTPKRIGNILAEDLSGDPQAVANTVYSNKYGNGDYNSGDGYKFRGRGVISLLGRTEYSDFAQSVGCLDIIENPDLVSDKFSFEAGLYFFDKHKLWSICDRGVSRAVITDLTMRVSKSTYKLTDRLHRTSMYARWLLQRPL